jgi:2'-5' RNA ligase
MTARDRASRPEAKPLRLFVAADVPEAVRLSLEDAVAPIRDRFPRARWVPRQNQHLTLKFLGATWPRLVEWVTSAVAAVAAAAEPFDTRVAGLGAFPNARRARVLWAGLEDPGARFAALAANLDDALSREFRSEKRPFAAHLTSARFEPPVAIGDVLEEVDVRSEPFAIDRIVLYRSHLRRPAPVYEALGTFPFET